MISLIIIIISGIKCQTMYGALLLHGIVKPSGVWWDPPAGRGALGLHKSGHEPAVIKQYNIMSIDQCANDHLG